MDALIRLLLIDTTMRADLLRAISHFCVHRWDMDWCVGNIPMHMQPDMIHFPALGLLLLDKPSHISLYAHLNSYDTVHLTTVYDELRTRTKELPPRTLLDHYTLN